MTNGELSRSQGDSLERSGEGVTELKSPFMPPTPGPKPPVGSPNEPPQGSGQPPHPSGSGQPQPGVPTSSLLAGFDLVLEIANATLLQLLKTFAQIYRLPLNPNDVLPVSFQVTGSDGRIHQGLASFTVTSDILLDLDVGNSLTLTIPFSSSITLDTLNLTSLLAHHGITISGIQVLLSRLPQQPPPGSPPQSSVEALMVDFSHLQADFDLEEDSWQLIGEKLQGSGISPQALYNAVKQAIVTFLKGALPQQVQIPGTQFTITPGVNVPAFTSGGVQTQFERLELHTIGNTERNKQSVALFGILLVANDANGDASRKTATALTANHGICVSLAPAAFEQLIFCPAVAQGLSTNVTGLPPSCGSQQQITIPQGVAQAPVPIQLTAISSSFNQGYIDVSGSISASGSCLDLDNWSAQGSFHGELTIPLSNNTLAPNLHMDPPNVQTHVPFLCELAADVLSFLVTGSTGLAAFLTIVIHTGALDDIINAVIPTPSLSVPSLGLGGLPGVSFDEDSITPEGLTLNGTVGKVVLLNGSVSTTVTANLGQGTEILPPVHAGGKPSVSTYEKQAQRQTWTYQALPSLLLGSPLTFNWLVGSQETSNLTLQGTSGSISLLAETSDPWPVPPGEKSPPPQVKEVKLQYAITPAGDTIQLTNDPKDANYTVQLQVQAQNPAGTTGGSTFVRFEGESKLQLTG
jgi:hypothetical protein